MKNRDIENISAVISYIEDCVKGDRPAGRCEEDKLDLDRIAAMFHYSKYYLHRMFTQTAGITIHDYIRRRQLTEAARWLVFSEKAILEIALAAGYESQQAFTGVFKSMYKKTPMEYKRNRMFYPLQLKLDLNRNPLVHGDLAGEIAYVGQEDIPAWMEFVSLVIDGFPGYDEEQHRRQLVACVEEKQALFMRDGAAMIGAAAFSRQDGRIDFLGIHPQYRRYGTGRKLLDFMLEHVFAADREEISITTFRQGDQADTGQREEYRKLGFGEAEFLVEFGYPTQRMVLRRGVGEASLRNQEEVSWKGMEGRSRRNPEGANWKDSEEVGRRNVKEANQKSLEEASRRNPEEMNRKNLEKVSRRNPEGANWKGIGEASLRNPEEATQKGLEEANRRNPEEANWKDSEEVSQRNVKEANQKGLQKANRRNVKEANQKVLGKVSRRNPEKPSQKSLELAKGTSLKPVGKTAAESVYEVVAI